MYDRCYNAAVRTRVSLGATLMNRYFGRSTDPLSPARPRRGESLVRYSQERTHVLTTPRGHVRWFREWKHVMLERIYWLTWKTHPGRLERRSRPK